ncbi:zinc finger CW-type PWWP domain protein 1-like [Trichomycterus rosablanca]|uniref:zinc finger CW-type PWWP domain protein 1-like n=1 Tax=Trichomycterus rosablanca TaxID=2290929 RepID=UPI002F35C4E1
MEEKIGQVETPNPGIPVDLPENTFITKPTKPGNRKETGEPRTDQKKRAEEPEMKAFVKKKMMKQIQGMTKGEEQDKQDETVRSVTSRSLMDLTKGPKDTEQDTHSEVKERAPEMDDKDRSEEADEDENTDDADQYVSWVQCSIAECAKWRKLSEDVDPSVLPDEWTCQQNTDPGFRSCRVPEEKCSLSEEIFCNLVPGSLVWARQIGYPWWPAIVERDPDTDNYLEFLKKSDVIPCKYHVTFLGDPATRAWVHRSRVKNYSDLSVDQLSKEIEKNSEDAVLMAKEAASLSLKERLVKFGFSGRFVSDRESSEEDSDIAEILELFCEKTESDCSDEDKKHKKQRLSEGKEKQRTGRTDGRKAANKKTSGRKTAHEKKNRGNKKTRGRREDMEGDQAVPSCSTESPDRTRNPKKMEQKSNEIKQNDKSSLRSDRKGDEDEGSCGEDFRILDSKRLSDRDNDEQDRERDKLLLWLLEE